MRTLLRLWTFCLPVFFSACSGMREEGIIVNLQTDYVAGLEFDQVRVEVDGSSGRELAVTARDSFARPRFVTTYNAAPRGQRRITLTLTRATREIARRTLEIPFEGNYLATVVITRSCATISCSVGESCLGARCVPDACITGTEPACPTPLCSSDAMCPSATSCAYGECVGGACLEVPTPGACSLGEACLPGTGCVSLEAPDAMSLPIDAASIPTDALLAPPSFRLFRLPAAATSWSLVTPTGSYPSDIVEAAFTISDGSLRVLTRTEVFTMSASGVFSARTPRDALFPELSGIQISAADRMGNTLTVFHGNHSTYAWRDAAPPVFVRTIPLSELPDAWRGAFAPSTYSVHALFSAANNTQGWAVPSPGAPCGVSGGYSEIIAFNGIGPSAMQDAIYSFDCDQFVARRDYGASLPFTFPGAPPSSAVEAISYAEGLWVFAR